MDETKLLVLADRFRKLRDRVDSLAAQKFEIKQIKGDQGTEGNQGPKGEQGDRGFDGAPGSDGSNGADGRDGQDGKDGISVINAEIAMDGSLVLYLSDGSEIDCGEVAQAKTENIFKSLTAGGGSVSIEVFTSLLPGLVPASGGGTANFLRADGTFAVPPISTPVVLSTASVTSPLAWDSSSYAQYALTALANSLTINADANASPVDGQKMMFRIKDNGTARALTWTTGSAKSFRVIGITLPTTTVVNKIVYVGCIYNAADSRWDVIAVGQEV